MPPKLSVTLRYMINGENVITTPCKTQALGAACLPKVSAGPCLAMRRSFRASARRRYL